MVNQVFLLGRVGTELESKSTKSGTSICTFSLATTESRKGSDGEWTKHTEWHRIVVFGTQADNLAKFCSKGEMLHIQGKLQTSEFETKEGQKSKSTQIICDKFTLVGSKKSEDNSDEPKRKKSTPKGKDSYEDDIPF